MSHNQHDPFSTQRTQTEKDPHKSFSGERFGLSSFADHSQASDSDAISAFVHSCRLRVSTSDDINASKQNDRGQDFLSLGATAKPSQDINRHSDVGESSVSPLSNYGQASAVATFSNCDEPSTSEECSSLAVSSKADRSIPGLRYSEPDTDRSSEAPPPNDMTEMATNILLKFGLEKEDLQHLFVYPEEKVTPKTLPFILRQIRFKKMAADANRFKPSPEPGPDRGHASGDSSTGPKDTPSTPYQSSSSINFSRIEEDVQGRAKRAEGDNLPTMADLERPCCQDLGQQVGRSSVSAPSRLDQKTSPSSFLTSASPKSHDLVKPTIVQSISPSFSLPKKNTDLRDSKYQAPKSSDLQQVHPVPKPILKPKPHALQPILRRANSSRPDHVVLGRESSLPSTTRSASETRGSSDQFKNIAPAGDDNSKKLQIPSQRQNFKDEQSQKDVCTQKAPEVKKTQQPPSNPQQPSKNLPLLPNPPKQQNPAKDQHLSVRAGPLCPSSGIAHDQNSTQKTVFKGLPAAVLLLDYAAATPKVFPHLCSLCNKECVHMKDWISHQNTNPHLENRQVLRQQYPEWNGKVVKSCKDKPNNEVPPPEVQSKKHHHGSGSTYRSRSSSRSVTPRPRRRRSCSAEARKDKRPKRSTRSPSPVSSKYQRRSRSYSSRSRSRSYSSNSPDCSRSRSRSYERRTSRRSKDGHLPSRRSGERRSSTRRRSSPRSWRDRRSSPKRSRERRSPDKRSRGPRAMPQNSQELSSKADKSRERRSPDKRNREPRAMPQNSQEPSTKSDRLAKQLMKTPVVQSLSKQTDLEALAKTLAPALLGELAKMKSTSSKESPAETSTAKTLAPASLGELAKMKSTSSKESPAETSTAKTLAPASLGELAKMKSTSSKESPAETSTASTSSANKKPVDGNTTSDQQKLSSPKTDVWCKSVKTSVPTMVILNGVIRPIAYKELVTAVEVYGKTKSVILFRQKDQAIVCFERKEDADKIRKESNIKIQGFSVSVKEEKEGISSVQKHNPQSFLRDPPSLDKVSKTQPSKSTSVAPAAQTEAKTIPSKPITKTVQKVPEMAKLNPTCEDIHVALKPTSGSEAALVTESMPQCSSEKSMLQDAAPQRSSEKAIAEVINPVCVTEAAAKKKVAPSQGYGPRLSKDALPKQSADISLKNAAAKLNPICEDIRVDLKDASGSEPALSTDSMPSCTSEQSLFQEAASQHSSEKAIAGDTPLTRVTEETVTTKAATSRGCGAGLAKDELPKQSADIPLKSAAAKLNLTCEEVSVDLKPTSGSEAALATDSMPLCTSEEALFMEALPQHSSEKAIAGETPSTCVTEAAITMKAAFSQGYAAGLAKDAVPPESANIPLKNVAAKLQPTCEEVSVDLKPTSGSEVALATDSMLLCTSDEALLQEAASKHSSEKAIAGETPPTCVTEAAITTKAAPSQGYAAGLAKDAVPPESSVVPLKSVSEPLLNFDEAATIDLVENRDADLALKDEAAGYWINACQSLHNSDVTLTIGERMCEFLLPDQIAVLGDELTNLDSKKFLENSRQLVIFNLPVDQHSYCVQEIIQLFEPFGFHSSADKIYVFPHSRMAFVELMEVKGVVAAIEACKTDKLTLKDQKLEVRVLTDKIPMWPRGFYQWVMNWANFPVEKDCPGTIFIKGITPSETASLREALRKIGGVKNFLPLHNKVFVEFESEISADRIGVWYMLHDQCPAYQIYRLDTPRAISFTRQMFPKEAMPDLTFAGATVETCTFGVPEFTSSPFYLTMRTKPYLFLTVSPWFIIPKFLTVKKEGDIKEARQLGASLTIMLTNLPEDSFKHEDVAKLAWPYFSQKDLRSLYYNVIVLPLQRRAFVHFSDWDACCRFVRYHLGVRKFWLNNHCLELHFVLQPMCAQNTEENMYRSLMQLSNSRIGEVESLAERLLCVEIGLYRKEIIRHLLHLISSHGELCIEMADSVGVSRVLEESKHFQRHALAREAGSCKVTQKFESIESLNRRLQEPTTLTLDLKEDCMNRSKLRVGPAPPATPSIKSELVSDSQEASPSAFPTLVGELTVGPALLAATSIESEEPTKELVSDSQEVAMVASPSTLPSAVGEPTVDPVPPAAPSIESEPPTKELVLDSQQVAKVAEDACKKTESCPSLHDSDLALTIGERMCQFLLPHKIETLRPNNLHQKIFAGKHRQLLISNLPVDQHSYCVQDIIQLVKPFGFESSDDRIYVLPQSRMAFVELTTEKGVVAAMDAWKTDKPTLKDQKLEARVLGGKVPMCPKRFYHWVMKQMKFPVEERCPRTISIKGITLSEMASLREALRKIGGVNNFLPLHNKVFVEFESEISADRIGVWYMLHDQCPAYSIYRLDNPQSLSVTAQMFPNEAMPDLAFAGAAVETCAFGIPELTLPPFYLTMGKKPFLFSTVSPWFIIPEFLTVKKEGDIKMARRLGASLTIMLTNLPENSFKHEEVARLAWPYFSQQDLRSLYYNVIVLPLQRRAFVHFSDWDACCRFVRHYLRFRTFRVKDRKLALHFVMQPMPAQNTEDNMYRSLMQLSNSRIGEVESLAERLLCVEIRFYLKENITHLLHLISSHGDIVNFLLLANRICIEMADSVGVARVLEESKHFPPMFQRHCHPQKVNSWKVMFESIDSLNWRLQDPTVFTLDRNGNREYRSMMAGYTPAPTAAPSIDSEKPAKEHVSESQGVVMVTEKDYEKTECCPSLHDSDVGLTIWNRMWKFLCPHRTVVLRRTNFHRKIFAEMKTQLVISNLPVDQHSYCVQDIIQLVNSFGVDSSVDMIYVLPQSRMALVEVTKQKGAFAAFNAWKPKMLSLNERWLEVRVLRKKVPMWPRGFYQWVMKWTNFPVEAKCSRTIFIQGITLSETASLREALRKIGGVKNFLPLHDKVFVEFDSDISADRLGVWYNLHHPCPAYSIYRLDVPEGVSVTPQMFPNEAIPDSAVAGATVETCTFGIPHLTLSPFYLTMRAIPFLFSTVNSWFIIPEFLTVKNEGDINEARQLGASPTIMLTNLPEDYFKHEDVAKLAWPYFSQKDLRSLYYNVIVLPLQRRAFVHFSDWDACSRFVQCHLGVLTFRVNGRRLGLHFVLQPMPAQNTEENMYRSLMQLSNSRIGEVESLAQRLLCVEINLSHKGNIRLLLHLISRHAEVVNFLPLANRICIEMADSAGVAHVLEESKHFSVSPRFSSAWKAIQRFESIESLNRRLQDSTDITLDLGEDSKDRSHAANPPAAGEPTIDPGPTAAPSVYSEQPIAGLMSESQGVEMADEEDCQKTECSNDREPTSIPEVQDDEDNVSEKVEDGQLSASACAYNETFLITVGSNGARVVQREEALPVQDTLLLGKDETLVKREDALVENNNVDLLDQQPFDIDDFVTISQVGYQEDSSGEAPSHSKRPSFPPDSKQNKTRASKESKNSKSSSSASSRTTRSSSRKSLSSGNVSSPVRHSTRAQSKAKKSKDSSKESQTHQTPTTCKEENLQMVLGDDQKPLSDEKLDVSEDDHPELQEVSKQGNISQVANAEKEQIAPVDAPNLEEHNESQRGKEMADVMKDVDKEQMAESRSAMRGVVEDQPSVDFDSHLREVKEHTAFSEHEDNEEEVDAYQEIDSVEDQPASTDNEQSVTEASKTQERKESPKKQKRITAKTPEPEKNLVVDSSNTPVLGRRRSTRKGKMIDMKEDVDKEQMAESRSAMKDVVEDQPSADLNSQLGEAKEDSTFSDRKDKEEEPDAYQEIDSVEDQSASTDNEQNVTEASKTQERKESPKKQKCVTAKTPEPEKNFVVDSSNTPVSGRRRSTRGMTQEQTAKIIVQDSLEEDACMTTRATRKRGRPPKKGTTSEEEKTVQKLTTASSTSAETTKRKTSIKKMEVVVIEKPTNEIQERIKDPAPKRKARKGRPRKGVKRMKINKKDTAAENQEAAATFEVLDSLEDVTSTEKMQSSLKREDRISPEKLEVEEEATYQLIDSLEKDPTKEETSATEVCGSGKTGTPQTELSDITARCENKLEVDIKEPSQTEAKTQQHPNKDDTPPVSSAPTLGHVEEDILICGNAKQSRTDHERISTSEDLKKTEEVASHDTPLEDDENKDALSAGQDSQASLEILGKGKRMGELVSPAVKRPRSESPFHPAAFGLPPFNPDIAQGTEFVKPKSGFFCEVCSIFYLQESTAKEVHCKSRKHYNNLKKHYNKCEKDSSASTQGNAMSD
ncbi:uncharacterized protein LOC130928910 isoform X2 [Corythoichthys intestinalis]|uniref:uncharacterized protein LOC130928910 isoform X2 n=1 Tax=Corythoichthys intestinalis TaxID=161448 RepID=UPI0025A4D6B1|nr:uncharacterized protein LOC130928910 isoform X2 [Corythoichthys intestinalis]